MPEQTSTHPEEPKNDWLDRLSRFNARFGRFLRDAFGVGVLALAAMTLLALWGISDGILLTPWKTFLEHWMGFGAHLFVLGMIFGGLYLLRRDDRPIQFGWIISFEIASLLTLGLFAAIGGFDLVRAELGLDGGKIGWGVGTFFTILAGPIWGIVILALLWLFFTLGAFNLWAWVE